jgi:hypothetical protein
MFGLRRGLSFSPSGWTAGGHPASLQYRQVGRSARCAVLMKTILPVMLFFQ